MSSQPKLTIKIKNKNPLDFDRVISSLNAFSKEYTSFCKKEFKGLEESTTKLQIHSLKEGSIELELVSAALALVPDINSTYIFGKYMIESLKFFTGKSDSKKPPDNFKNKSAGNFIDLLEQTANDAGSNLNIINSGNNNTYNINVSSSDARVAQNRLAKYNTELLQEKSSIKDKQLFYWSTASFVKNKSGDKGFIESIDKAKPHKIIFPNESDKKIMTTSSNKFKADWQDLMYIVDVEVLDVQGKIQAYKILKVYEEDTFEKEN